MHDEPSLLVTPHLEVEPRIAVSQGIASEIGARLQVSSGNVRDAQVRVAFVEQRGNAKSATPLASLIRGGRGGEVRLKLLLSVLWIAVGEPHTVSMPNRVWAQLLGLEDPETRGSRRVADAFKWLVERKFLDVTREGGAPPVYRLLEETGSGRPYVVPGAAIGLARAKGEEWGHNRYIKVPPQLWTNGWLPALSGAALAMLLVLLTNGRGDRETWFTPQIAETRYRLSADTRQRGTSDLTSLGLLVIHRVPVSRTQTSMKRRRNLYELQLERLQAPPAEVAKPRRSKKVAGAQG